MNLAIIKKINWQYLVSRRESLFFESITENSSKYFRKLAHIPWRNNYILRFSDGPLFYSQKDIDKLRAFFFKKGLKALIDFCHPLICYVKSLDRIARRIEEIDCTKLNKFQIVKLLNNYIKAAIFAHNFLSPMPIADGVISKMILDLLPQASEEQKQKWLSILIYPIKENEHTKEEKSFYKLAQTHKNKDISFDNLIKVHLKKFGWIGARYFWHKAWIEDDIKDRIVNLFTQKKNPIAELKHLNSIHKERVKAAEKLLKKLNIRKFSLLYKLIRLAREYAYLKTWRTDIMYRADYRTRNLFYEVARRANFRKNNISYLTFFEIIKMAKTNWPPINSKELVARKKFNVGILIKNQYTVLSGREWFRRIKAIVSQKLAAVNEIKGNSAFQGRARGIARIVQTTNDLNKVKRGDVLVAVMTFPHFIIAMEKASAFVTDEGGILCHAAIVSREMRKPCIIGTKIATKVLKDGDLVEVDANKGIVKIIKRK